MGAPLAPSPLRHRACPAPRARRLAPESRAAGTWQVRTLIADYGATASVILFCLVPYMGDNYELTPHAAGGVESNRTIATLSVPGSFAATSGRASWLVDAGAAPATTCTRTSACTRTCTHARAHMHMSMSMCPARVVRGSALRARARATPFAGTHAHAHTHTNTQTHTHTRLCLKFDGDRI